MGRAGWVPLDPTTGELESLNATHIKLFEGMGGVVPRRVHVVEFQPPNRPLANVQPAEAKPLPWQIGKRYLFRYKQGETDIGTEAFTITKVQRDGKDAYEVNSDVDLKVGGFTVKGTTRLSTAANGEPFAFVRDLDAAGQQYKMECAFKDGEVDVKVSGAKELTRQIKIPRGAYCFDNNLLSSWAIICPQLHFEKDEDVEVRVFHPSSLQVIPLTFKPQRQAPVSVDGKQTPCWQCEVDPIQNTFWITGDGRFVKAQQGKLTMELAEEKK